MFHPRFRPSPPGDESSTIDELNTLLQQYLGTVSFHNFTSERYRRQGVIAKGDLTSKCMDDWEYTALLQRTLCVICLIAVLRCVVVFLFELALSLTVSSLLDPVTCDQLSYHFQCEPAFDECVPAAWVTWDCLVITAHSRLSALMQHVAHPGCWQRVLVSSYSIHDWHCRWRPHWGPATRGHSVRCLCATRFS